LERRAAHLARTQSELAAFRIRYRADVGRLHDELDELDRAIAEAELGEINKRLDADQTDAGPTGSEPPTPPASRFTSDAVRRLFRDIAKTIHPDLARDEQTRDRRHALM